MPSSGLACVDRSFLLVVDVQPSFLRVCADPETALKRIKVLVQAAKLLDVPIFATEQYPSRMGGTEPELRGLLPVEPAPFGKMSFSAWGEPEVLAAVQASGRTQAILCGIETQICITQTTHDLLEAGYEVFLPVDAITGRGVAEKEIALKRMTDVGAVRTLTDSVLYEWLQTADHPQFRTVLELVKG